MSKHEFVDTIRAASRQMVRELGFMQATLAATNYPASAVHTILEIGARGSMTAAELSDFLGLEKSSVSRMVRKLVEAGELQETASGQDGRAKLLSLTSRGEHTRASIQDFGRQQVTTALAHLRADQQQAVGQGLTAYAGALKAHRLGEAISTAVDSITTSSVATNIAAANMAASNAKALHPDATDAHATSAEPIGVKAINAETASAIQIAPGYQAGAIGRITEMHARFYARHAGFGQFFESKVAAGLAEFTGRLGNPRNSMWIATQGDRIVGSVSIDGEDLGQNLAHLRWFIVDDGLRGAGLGRQLLAQALDFCDRQGFAAVHLWTFKSLDAARRLYEEAGFKLAEEQPGSQWGKEVVEQRFIR
ncbi:MarR family transcriptional regulator [Pigmentiphaga aceris]|uniref:MarR family transcriptional regulator n=1 Tax=Pigmentiphaga aceris TaxID=1940612 RepID=A0A5C0AXS2_9BURK|nr:helix-turn-helix domain-containing GNAT family N-acetyltransferase [Pigmentiphaga aceris]QEI06536.1 MarR family transcriptional regulator [Pigmentiphaga aceris]